MTANQINYAKHLEEVRHNKATESETARHNIVGESQNYQSLSETQRHNKATEDVQWGQLGVSQSVAAESIRHNTAMEAETNRSNVAKETETNRANVAKETETNRHNLAQEWLNLLEADATLVGGALATVEGLVGNTGYQGLDTSVQTVVDVVKDTVPIVGRVISEASDIIRGKQQQGGSPVVNTPSFDEMTQQIREQMAKDPTNVGSALVRGGIPIMYSTPKSREPSFRELRQN